jgi:hypothetical protein
MYESRKMRHVETIPGRGEGRYRRIMEGVNSTKIYCKNFCKCHNVPLHYTNNRVIKMKDKIIKVSLFLEDIFGGYGILG